MTKDAEVFNGIVKETAKVSDGGVNIHKFPGSLGVMKESGSIMKESLNVIAFESRRKGRGGGGLFGELNNGLVKPSI